jgi:DNA-binding transcriptional LysR family regulator
MDVRQLRYFMVVAHQRHFTRAAAELHIAQPALSQQIAQLERELGVLLLDRTNRRVRLTSAGEALLPRAERILAEVERTEEEMRAYAGVVRGRVVVGTLAFVAAFRLPALLARFHAFYPGVEIVLREEATEQLAALLAAGRVDLALVHVTEEDLPPSLADAAVATEPLYSEDLVLIMAPDHPLAERGEVALAELRDEVFIAFKPGSGLRRALARAGEEAGFKPRVIFESGDLGAIRGLVAAGLGISVVPRSVAEAPGAAIAVVPLGALPLTRTVLLAWRRDHYRSPAAEACLAFIRADVEQHPWQAG